MAKERISTVHVLATSPPWEPIPNLGIRGTGIPSVGTQSQPRHPQIGFKIANCPVILMISPAMMKALDRFSARVDWFNERLGRVVCWLTLAMVLIASYNTVARYSGRYLGINLTSNALLELQWYLFSVVFLLGGAYALKRNAHVRVDVIFERLSPKARASINLAGTFLFLIPFSCMMLWATWGSVASSWAIMEQSSDPDGLPRYPVKTLIPIAFILLIFQGLSEAVKQVRVFRGKEDSSVAKKDSI